MLSEKTLIFSTAVQAQDALEVTGVPLLGLVIYDKSFDIIIK